MDIAIIGAGYAGLTAAYDLARAGHTVSVYEAAPEAGGLAAGFKAPHWEWPLEKFYHHLFTNDEAILDFCRQIGIGDKLSVYRPSTDLVHEGKPYPFDSPVAALKYPGFSFLEKARAGLTMVYLKLRHEWRPFEEVTAHEWMRRAMGGAYDKQFGPLLRGKFGEENFRDVPMTWMWARLLQAHAQADLPRRGLPEHHRRDGTAVEALGVTIHLDTPVRALRHEAGGWAVQAAQGSARFERVIATVSPALLTRLVPELPASYLASLAGSEEHGGGRDDGGAGPPTHREKLLAQPEQGRLSHALAGGAHQHGGAAPLRGRSPRSTWGTTSRPTTPISPTARSSCSRCTSRCCAPSTPPTSARGCGTCGSSPTTYAQPVPTLRYGERIPPLRTPLSGLYFASMSQVYPWDRGTNYAVEIGHKVAQELLADRIGAMPHATVASPRDLG